MARARRGPGTYTRVVGFLKIALPLIALALLSTVFLVQKEDTIAGGVVFTKGDRASMRDGLTVNNPELTGVTSTGDRFFMKARKAVPDSSEVKVVTLNTVDARTEYTSGRTIYLTANEGIAFVPEQRIELDGDLNIKTSDGYTGVTQSGIADLANGTIYIDTPIVLEGPTGRLEAGTMRVENIADPATSRNNQMFTFENGVKLTFQPG